MTASLLSLLAPDDEDEEEEEDCEGGVARVASMLSMYSLMCCSCTPLAMLLASFAPTSPRNVSMMNSRVFSSTALFDALSASERALHAILIGFPFARVVCQFLSHSHRGAFIIVFFIIHHL